MASATDSRISDFELQPLLAPGHKALATYKGGYVQYVSDYKLYRATLSELKAEGLKEAVEKKKTVSTTSTQIKLVSAMSQSGGIVYGGSMFSGLAQGASTKMHTWVDGSVGRQEMFDVGEIKYTNRSGQPSSVSIRDSDVTYLDAVSKFPPGVFEVKVSTSRSPKPKGPATTPPKVRTPEETAQRAEKERARKARLVDRKVERERSALLKKEEKEAASAHKRAADLKKAVAPDVIVTSEPVPNRTGEWKVVTRSGHVKSTTWRGKKDGGSVVSKVLEVSA